MRTRIHRSRLTLVPLAAAAITLFALAGCTSAPAGSGDTSSGDSSSAPADDSSGDSGSGDASAAALTTADSDLGTIVVDGKKMTVYMFDKDTQNATSSACSGQCATAWPAVHADSDSPKVDGVTGKIGTITGTDGEKQLTLDGWPLYYYAADKAAGDTTGQGVGGVWWVLGPDGSKISS
ncbi:hypothetical protein GCM10027515_18970 [Schumannella luteola]|uniref:Putative lipoprotein with Yx(FWY)xxD motif n=1 Tax=Schumannella luteola TaxID=472059 RepID=A0A852YK06_9MICO|nr:hypothetical protein [Schumannella luteola]NYH00308.1 putative lipoprotein with Yx(FWY)xxD motif [Schumannella luteola]TPX06003.1 hypothetical protein FJ656_03845 [Schumannella luteola]